MKHFRRKGLEFEKEVAKSLSNWFNSESLIFWRTFGSGSAKNKGENFIGDITSLNHIGKAFTEVFYVECKRYKEFNLSNLLDGKSNFEKKLILDNLIKSNEAGKLLFLLVKRNFSKNTILFLEVLDFSKLESCLDVSLKLKFDDRKIIVTTFEHLISSLSPEEFLERIRRV